MIDTSSEKKVEIKPDNPIPENVKDDEEEGEDDEERDEFG